MARKLTGCYLFYTDYRVFEWIERAEAASKLSPAEFEKQTGIICKPSVSGKQHNPDKSHSGN